MLSLHSIFTERMCEDLHQTRLQMYATDAVPIHSEDPVEEKDARNQDVQIKIQCRRSYTAAKIRSKFMKDVQCSIHKAYRTPWTPWGRTQDQAGIYSWWGKQKQPRSQAVNVRIQLQKVQKFRGLFRSHDEPLLFSAGCCSSSCGVFPKVLCTPPVHQYLCAAAQRSDEFILDLDPLLISKELELPRTKMSRGSRSKCSVYSWRVCIDKIRRWSRRDSAATFVLVLYLLLLLYTACSCF